MIINKRSFIEHRYYFICPHGETDTRENCVLATDSVIRVNIHDNYVYKACQSGLKSRRYRTKETVMYELDYQIYKSSKDMAEQMKCVFNTLNNAELEFYDILFEKD